MRRCLSADVNWDKLNHKTPCDAARGFMIYIIAVYYFRLEQGHILSFSMSLK